MNTFNSSYIIAIQQQMPSAKQPAQAENQQHSPIQQQTEESRGQELYFDSSDEDKPDSLQHLNDDEKTGTTNLDLKHSNQLQDSDCKCKKSQMLEQKAPNKEMPQYQSSNCQLPLLPIAKQYITPKRLTSKMNKPEEKKQEISSSIEAQDKINNSIEKGFPVLQKKSRRASKSCKKQQQQKPQKAELFNLSFQAALVTRNLSKLAFNLGSCRYMPAQEMAPVSKRTRKQMKKLKKNQEKRINKSKRLTKIVDTEEIHSISQTQSFIDHSDKVIQSTRKTKLEREDEQLSQSIPVKKSASKSKKKRANSSRRKKSTKRKTQYLEQFEPSLEQISELVIQDNQESNEIIKSDQLSLKEIRQIETIAHRHIEYAVTLSDDSVKIIPMAKLMKAWPNQFVEYLEKKLKFGTH